MPAMDQSHILNVFTIKMSPNIPFLVQREFRPKIFGSISGSHF